jgi:ribosomal protein S12 methylthiotransferase accessory factor
MQTERDEQAKMISKIRMEIHVPPEFPERYKRAIISAASLCSVKKHIERPPAFEIEAIIG